MSRRHVASDNVRPVIVATGTSSSGGRVLGKGNVERRRCSFFVMKERGNVSGTSYYCCYSSINSRCSLVSAAFASSASSDATAAAAAACVSSVCLCCSCCCYYTALPVLLGVFYFLPTMVKRKKLYIVGDWRKSYKTCSS